MADIEMPLVVSDRLRDTLSRDTGFVVGPDGNSIVGYMSQGNRVEYRPGVMTVSDMLSRGPVYFVNA